MSDPSGGTGVNFIVIGYGISKWRQNFGDSHTVTIDSEVFRWISYEKKSTCMVSSVCIVSICIKITEYIKCGFILFFITMGAVICLYCHSPVDNINRKLNCDEKRDCRKTTRIRVIACLAIAFLTYIFKMPQYTVCISLALILTAVLQLLAIAHNKIDRSACMKYLSTK